jgi:FkbM family methyltransferase
MDSIKRRFEKISLINSYLKQKCNKLLIEVGSYDGADSLSFYKKGYKVYTFEPNRLLYGKLKHRTSEMPNYIIIPKAVCLNDGVTQFNICKYGGASSILKFKSDEELNKNWTSERWDLHYSGFSYEVETTRLDTFIEQNNLQDTVIDYLHVDAQGVDLDVLISLGKYIKNVQAGVVETVKDKEKSIYIDQINILDNVKEFLMFNGFKINLVESNDPTLCEYNVHFSK